MVIFSGNMDLQIMLFRGVGTWWPPAGHLLPVTCRHPPGAPQPLVAARYARRPCLRIAVVAAALDPGLARELELEQVLVQAPWLCL